MLAFLLIAAVTLVPGSTGVWTDGTNIWAGNPWCGGGYAPSPESPVIDKGSIIEGFHCPAPGLNPSGCREWFGKAPDIGACEFVPGLAPDAPKSIQVL